MVRFDAFRGYLLETEALPLDEPRPGRRGRDAPALQEQDDLVGDRAFASYAHLALCRRRGVHGVFRAHQRQIIDFRVHRRWPARGRRANRHSRWLKRLGKHDQLVEYFKPPDCERPAWMTAEQYAQLPGLDGGPRNPLPIGARGRRTRVVTLVTTLVDAEHLPGPGDGPAVRSALAAGDPI